MQAMTRNLTLIATLLPGFLFAQNPLSVSKPEKDNTVKGELASFTVDKRLSVNLFADESMGIANPVCMRWDARGRLWVHRCARVRVARHARGSGAPLRSMVLVQMSEVRAWFLSPISAWAPLRRSG